MKFEIDTTLIYFLILFAEKMPGGSVFKKCVACGKKWGMAKKICTCGEVQPEKPQVQRKQCKESILDVFFLIVVIYCSRSVNRNQQIVINISLMFTKVSPPSFTLIVKKNEWKAIGGVCLDSS